MGGGTRQASGSASPGPGAAGCTGESLAWEQTLAVPPWGPVSPPVGQGATGPLLAVQPSAQSAMNLAQGRAGEGGAQAPSRPGPHVHYRVPGSAWVWVCRNLLPPRGDPKQNSKERRSGL